MSANETALRRALQASDSEQVVRLLEPLARDVASHYFAASAIDNGLRRTIRKLARYREEYFHDRA